MNQNDPLAAQAMSIVSHSVEFLRSVTTRCIRLEAGNIKEIST